MLSWEFLEKPYADARLMEDVNFGYALDVARYDKIRNGLEQRRQKNKTGPVLVFSAGNPRHRDYP